MSITSSILIEVAQERARQDQLWGEQNHPLVCQATGDAESEHHGHEHEVERFQYINGKRAEINALAWDGILMEEVSEAFAERDPLKARAELVQVAAVAVAAIEAIDRATS